MLEKSGFERLPLSPLRVANFASTLTKAEAKATSASSTKAKRTGAFSDAPDIFGFNEDDESDGDGNGDGGGDERKEKAQAKSRNKGRASSTTKSAGRGTATTRPGQRQPLPMTTVKRGSTPSAGSRSVNASSVNKACLDTEVCH